MANKNVEINKFGLNLFLSLAEFNGILEVPCRVSAFCWSDFRMGWTWKVDVRFLNNLKLYKGLTIELQMGTARLAPWLHRNQIKKFLNSGSLRMAAMSCSMLEYCCGLLFTIKIGPWGWKQIIRRPVATLGTRVNEIEFKFGPLMAAALRTNSIGRRVDCRLSWIRLRRRRNDRSILSTSNGRSSTMLSRVIEGCNEYIRSITRPTFTFEWILSFCKYG